MVSVAEVWMRDNTWSLKVEKGDLKQDEVVYPNMVRRITLVNSKTNEHKVEVFKGSSCKDKAEQWFGDATDGAFGSPAETRWMWL